jgi:polar amino acid transport system substrate-binding protein
VAPIPSAEPSVAPVLDQLARVVASGTLRVNTDPNYAPQSFQNPDGSFDGFDVDVAREIARRLGLDIEFTTFGWDLTVAGSWNDRWDISVGSMTITEERKDVLDFTRPYYFTPAQMAATVASGITTLDGLAGQVICVGTATTYQEWLEGTLNLSDAPTPASPPPGATVFTLPTDQECAQAAQSGRTDFTGWLSSSTTVDSAIKAGTPMVKVGDPVFYESLAVAFDQQVEDRASFVAAVDAVVQVMHDDGTLSELSKKWFDGLDLTVAQ